MTAKTDIGTQHQATGPGDAMRSRRLHTTLGVLALVFWSTTLAVGSSVTKRLGPLTAASSIYLVGGVLACAVLLTSARQRRALLSLPMRYLLGCGALFVLYMASLYVALGLAKTPQQAITVGLVNYLWPGLLLALSVWLQRKRARWTLAPGLLVAFSGIVLAMLERETPGCESFADRFRAGWTAYALAFVAAVAWGFYSNLSRKWAGGSEGNGVPLFIIATGLVLFPFRFVFAEKPEWSAAAAWEVVFMAVLPGFLAYQFWDSAMRRGEMVLVAVLSHFIPIVAVVLASLYRLGRLPGVSLWAGCALVTAGAFVARYSITERTG